MRAGYLSFMRNGWLSTATIMVMAMVLFVLGNLIFLGAFAGTALDALESKIDISVYFKPEAGEEEVLAVRDEIAALPDVAEVQYVSKEEALARFSELHKNNALITDALAEIGENPLQASVAIRARDTEKFASISEFLLDRNYPAVDKINYFENETVINRLSSIVGTVRTSGVGLVLLLAFIAVLVAFNTIRLAIYTMREEIGIMRLVGATKWFVRGPFVVSGVLYGIIAAGITTLIFFPVAWLVSPKLTLLLSNFDLFKYFLTNFWQFLAVMLIAGMALGVASSMIAIRRYLEA